MRLLLLFAVIVSLSAPAKAGALPRQGSETPGARRAICSTFGRYCPQALSVAWCESRMNVWASNGQYLGLFQMGSWARSRFGHSSSPWGQARAAFRYFVYAGWSWSPWACRPW